MKPLLFLCLFIFASWGHDYCAAADPATGDKSRQKADTLESRKAEAPITSAFLRLYADPDPEVSLGAMLVSAHAGFPDSKPLVEYIRAHRAKHEAPYERTIKNYAVAWLQYGNDEAANLVFAREFPDKPEDLLALLNFEERIKSPPFSYLLEALLILADSGGDAADNREAKKKKVKLKEVAGDWGTFASQLNRFDELGY